jgi:hypothetical protein
MLTDAVFGFRFDLRHGSNDEDIGRSLFDFDFVDLVAVAVELLVELLVVAILLRVLHPRVLLLSCWYPEEAGGSLNFGFSLPFSNIVDAEASLSNMDKRE